MNDELKKILNVWQKKFSPKRVEIPESLYSNYLPKVNVIPIPIYDENVIDMDLQFTAKISSNIRKIVQTFNTFTPVNIQLTLHQLFNQIPLILSGFQSDIIVSRNSIPIKRVKVTEDLYQAIKNIQLVINERLLLFEDIPSEIPLKENTLNAFLLDDENKRKYRKSEKSKSIIGLVKSETGVNKNVIIFVRSILVANSLLGICSSNGIKAITLHSKIKDRAKRIQEFKHNKPNVLIVTRQMYGRGFDLPQADTAIFYSPKEDEKVMWQEMLRIRSTHDNLKSVYILFYSWTAESSKISRLIDRMLSNGAFPLGNGFIWTYRLKTICEALTIFKDNNRNFYSRNKYQVKDKDESTSLFISKIFQNLKTFSSSSFGDTFAKLMDFANEIKLTKYWNENLVRNFITDIASSIDELLKKKEQGIKSLWRALSKKCHTDKHEHEKYPNEKAKNKALEFWKALQQSLASFNKEVEI